MDLPLFCFLPPYIPHLDDTHAFTAMPAR